MPKVEQFKMRDEWNADLRRIQDMLHDAEAQMKKAGAPAMVEQFYSRPRTAELTSLKEEWTMGSFAARFNRYHTPELIWARHNPANIKRADFSVYGSDCSLLCDVEITSLWSTPTAPNPKAYEDFSPYPVWPDRDNPEVLHVDIDQPPKVQPYARLERVIEAHLRDEYPAYWLVIWDNDHAVCHPNLDELAQLVRRILETKWKSGALPAGLQQVWLFDENDAKPRQIQFGK